MYRRSCDRRPITAALLAALLLFGGPVIGADENKSASIVRDAYYGEALYHFFQQDNFTALTHLLAARKAGRISKNSDEAELLLGGLYLSYGQHERAGEIFDRLLSQVTDPAVRNRAWFFLGKVRYQRGLYEQAVVAFRKADPGFSSPFSAELRSLLAQSYLGAGDFAAAAEVLDAWSGSDIWTPYARVNLGVALIRLGRNEEGIAQLDRVGQMTAGTPELINLRDKANVALGYTYLQWDKPAQARAVLERVRLHGPFSSKALLGAGWADLAQKNYRAALTPWLELGNRDLMDTAVQESLLAVPYALQQLDADGSAADYYQQSLVTFGDEMGRLDAAINRARSGELVPALLRVSDPGIGHWYWQLEELPDSTDSRYLYDLIADHGFQEGLRNSRDLLALEIYLGDWQQKLAAFRDMLDTRTQAYEQRIPAAEAKLEHVNPDDLGARRDAARARLETVEQARDVMSLATEQRQLAWQRLNEFEQLPAWGVDESSAARQKQRILKGIVLWDADKDYRYRLWQQTRELDELDAALEQTGQLWTGVGQAQLDDPNARVAYADQIANLESRLVRMRSQIAAALDQQKSDLQILTVQALKNKKERLSNYRVQARFALAAIFDRATVNAAGAGSEP